MNSRRLKVVFLTVALVLFFHLSLGLERENTRYFSGRIAQSQITPIQERGKVISVRALGAKGDGVSDDTAAIQSAINGAKAGETIYFPAGIYDVSELVVKARTALSFAGEGRKSVIRQKTGAARIATVEKSRDIVISNLTFDANGIMAYGGVVFYSVTGVRIENNTFIDGAPKPWGEQDRNTFMFARGSEPSKDIKISNNTIEDLQLDFNHAQGVVIERNVLKRGGKTAGIGIYTEGDNAIAENFQITNNTVIDPIGAGFYVGIDPPTDGKCIFRGITLADNQVIRTRTSGYGILVGTSNNSIKTAGNVFENIVIKNNSFRTELSAPQPMQLILANTTNRAGIIFTRMTVSGNKIENERQNGGGYAIDLRGIQKSLVTDNTIKRAANGISLSGDLLSNEVRDNVVEASDVAYSLDGSLGGNKTANNRIVGNPNRGWMLEKLHSSDLVGK
jgi:hypothetical protein